MFYQIIFYREVVIFMKTVAFHTLGCRVNQYETEAVCELFLKEGYTYVDFHTTADVYVINTCTVTGESDRKSRQMIRRAKKTNPDSVVVVMGCLAQVNQQELSVIEDVDILIGTKHRDKALALVEDFLKTKEKKSIVGDNHLDPFEPLSISTYTDKTRAYIKIQEGCEQFCTYCIIPYARGKLASRSEEDVLEEAERLADAGFREIILTGIHIASYGRDTKKDSLLSVLTKLNGIDGIDRIRLGSLEPNLMDFDFVEKIAGIEKLCPHFHISLQSGCDATLLRMNRKYTANQYRAYLEAIRKAMPDAAITTDVMVGFPDESDEEFNESYRFIEEMQFSHIHTFMYSRRKNTPAATFKNQIPSEIKKERSKKMIALSEKSRMEFLQKYKGQTVEVLFEQMTKDGFMEGYTRNYQKVSACGDIALKGKIQKVQIQSVDSDAMVGVLI